MTKGEFLYNLRNSLTGIPKEDLEGIIEDYSMHINEMLDERMALEEVLIKLGDPKEIAKQYLEELGYEYKGYEESNQFTNYENSYEVKENKSKNVPLFIIMQFVNFVMLSGVLFGLGVAIFSIGVSGIAVAGSSIAVLFIDGNSQVFVRVLKMFVLIGVGVLLFNGALAVAIALGKVLIKYAKWNISLIS